MAKTKTVQELIAEGELMIEHGDYQRIANLTTKSSGEAFTADYVHKVLKGMRNNKLIERKARLYLKQKARMLEKLKTHVDAE